MRYLGGTTAAFFAFGVVVLSACGANNSAGVVAPAVGAQAGQPVNDMRARNVSGQYSGGVKDTSFGKGTATASFSQFGGNVGGAMVLTFGTAGVTTSIAASLVGDALRGRNVGMISSVACGFVFTGNYDPANYRLSGIYRAVNGCSGEKGTFSMKEQCYYVRDWDAVRRDGGPAHC